MSKDMPFLWLSHNPFFFHCGLHRVNENYPEQLEIIHITHARHANSWSNNGVIIRHQITLDFVLANSFDFEWIISEMTIFFF